jgi:hypothetical protein
MKIERKDLAISTVSDLQFKIGSLIEDIDINTLNDEKLSLISEIYKDFSILLKTIVQIQPEEMTIELSSISKN